MSHSVVGKYTQTRQRRLRGQDRKTLVTAGAMKRPLPCPVERVEKQSTFYNVKRKKIRTKTEKKRKKTKKERRELVQ